MIYSYRLKVSVRTEETQVTGSVWSWFLFNLIFVLLLVLVLVFFLNLVVVQVQSAHGLLQSWSWFNDMTAWTTNQKQHEYIIRSLRHCTNHKWWLQTKGFSLLTKQNFDLLLFVFNLNVSMMVFHHFSHHRLVPYRSPPAGTVPTDEMWRQPFAFRAKLEEVWSQNWPVSGSDSYLFRRLKLRPLIMLHRDVDLVFQIGCGIDHSIMSGLILLEQ